MTGSGKTFTMSGREEVICQDGYKGDTKDGIVTQSVNYLYKQVSGHACLGMLVQATSSSP
jgi:hypothetical protein